MTLRLRELGEEEATYMQVGVLMRIMEQPLTTSELAKQRKVSLQAASVLVQGLVDRGWLTREPDPNDRRQSLLQITPEGMARTHALREQMTHLVAEALGQLSPDELHAASIFLPALHHLVTAQMRSHGFTNPSQSSL